jgi:cephalosporin-C deacetylase
MALFDLSLDELRSYDPRPPAPPDLEEFWARTLTAARSAAPAFAATFEPVASRLTVVEAYDVTLPGFGGDPVRGWLHLPAGTTERLPTVVRYLGYTGGRGLPHEVSVWALAGYACLVVDTRGQGTGTTAGDTADPGGTAGPSYPGFMTRGVLDPDTYYYRRVFTDAVRALDAVREHPRVDPDRVAVTGSSQGGGITIAAAALADGVAAAMPDVPFLCHFQRATEITDEEPYFELAAYLKVHRDHLEQVFRTLSYVDGAVLGRLASAPALFSAGLMDRVCPPSTVFAAFHAYGGLDKQIEVYPYNEHEGGQAYHQQVQLDWLADHFKR